MSRSTFWMKMRQPLMWIYYGAVVGAVNFNFYTFLPTVLYWTLFYLPGCWYSKHTPLSLPSTQTHTRIFREFPGILRFVYSLLGAKQLSCLLALCFSTSSLASSLFTISPFSQWDFVCNHWVTIASVNNILSARSHGFLNLYYYKLFAAENPLKRNINVSETFKAWSWLEKPYLR